MNRQPPAPRPPSSFSLLPSAFSSAGFTLLEVLVVVLIITILATVVGVNVVNKPGEAKVAAARANLESLRTALNLYRMQNGTYPTQEQGLEALVDPPTAEPVPRQYPEGGYLERRSLLTDPWGNPFVYLVPGPERQPFELLSYGADGNPGGERDNADLSTAESP